MPGAEAPADCGFVMKLSDEFEESSAEEPGELFDLDRIELADVIPGFLRGVDGMEYPEVFRRRWR